MFGWPALEGKHQNSTISTTETTETTNGYRPTLWDDIEWRVGYPLVGNIIAAAERLRRQALSRRPSAAALLWLGLQMVPRPRSGTSPRTMCGADAKHLNDAADRGPLGCAQRRAQPVRVRRGYGGATRRQRLARDISSSDRYASFESAPLTTV